MIRLLFGRRFNLFDFNCWFAIAAIMANGGSMWWLLAVFPAVGVSVVGEALL